MAASAVHRLENLNGPAAHRIRGRRWKAAKTKKYHPAERDAQDLFKN
jgi:hypothetical protein